MHGSYEALKYGNLLDGLADLTGGITESLNISDLADATALHNLMKTTSVVTAYRLPNVNKIIVLKPNSDYKTIPKTRYNINVLLFSGRHTFC